MKKVVIKIGSSSLIDEFNQINNRVIVELIRQIDILKKDNIAPIIVTSGAVALGYAKLGAKSKDIKTKQAAASIGQVILMNGYEHVCEMFGLSCGQILVNHTDFDDRKREVSLQNTIDKLISNNIIPIINENDALAADEIMVGDNDTLSAMVSCLVDASMLLLLSDVDGLYTDNPKLVKDASLIKVVDSLDSNILSFAKDSSTSVGTGGMRTKINAAKIVNSKGIDMIIMNSNNISLLSNCFKDNYSGTLFKGSDTKLSNKKSWLLFSTISKGSVVINEGCYKALIKRSSILAVGIINVFGIFECDAIVDIIYNEKVVAKGICNYNCLDLSKIKQMESNSIKNILGDSARGICIHANNIVLIGGETYE